MHHASEQAGSRQAEKKHKNCQARREQSVPPEKQHTITTMFIHCTNIFRPARPTTTLNAHKHTNNYVLCVRISNTCMVMIFSVSWPPHAEDIPASLCVRRFSAHFSFLLVYKYRPLSDLIIYILIYVRPIVTRHHCRGSTHTCDDVLSQYILSIDALFLCNTTACTTTPTNEYPPSYED